MKLEIKTLIDAEVERSDRPSGRSRIETKLYRWDDTPMIQSSDRPSGRSRIETIKDYTYSLKDTGGDRPSGRSRIV